MEENRVPLEKIDDYRWRIPKSFKPGMRVPGLIYADEKLLKDILRDRALEQVANVAYLPGIVNYSLGMPDIHWGYGAPIGGVAAFDLNKGIIAPGMIGYDINCGVRLIRTNLELEEVKNKLVLLIDALFSNIPCGVGVKGRINLSPGEEREVLVKGTKWAIEKGYGWEEDIELTEENGCLKGADPHKVSARALERGKQQLGTLGSGNHFLEVQLIQEIYDAKVAKIFGLEKGGITIMIHCGSRGFGHQVCDDYLRIMGQVQGKYKINLPDRQLACAPLDSPEGKDYFAAMACAANYAWVNRQCIMHWTREVLEKVFQRSSKDLGLNLVYDVTHNIAKFEEHTVEGKKKKLCIHRKGATRAFPANHPAIPQKYRSVGQPVIIPGDMGRNSYVLIGTETAMEETFGTTCHGAGRVMSRAKAIKITKGRNLKEELKKQGIIVRAKGRYALSEEVPEAYKDVNEVAYVVHEAGISRKVAKLKPLGVIKG